MGTALITGASSGLGREFARQIAWRGHDVVLVARDRERLEALADELELSYRVRAEVLPADLSLSDDLARVCERLTSVDDPVGLLVNNAGYTVHGRFLRTEIRDQRSLEAVMVGAVMELSHAGARAMLVRGRGAILNVSSVASLTTAGTYSAHKAWVRTFTEGLAAELDGKGVTATALCPGFVHTEFHKRANIDETRIPEIAWLDVRYVVRAALEDVNKGRVISTPSFRYKVASAVLRILPRRVIRGIQHR
ncbi:SDR family oxidoreductase [Timonella senegalensis]|uniref:SDR family NAD(P)-dependent oxidoreductase n=1 Tax=Timonella senegalensis TaxID=1465825 RepID=UPI0028B193B8|nr:SDR family oxidoreductase [Timonella senegalensis]